MNRNPSPLPPELVAVEQRLESARAEPRASWSAALPRQVQRRLGESRMASRWSFAAAVAASALIWLNFSLFAATASQLHLHSTAAPTTVAPGELRSLLPELNDEELQSMLVRINARTSSVPAVMLPALRR